MQAGKGPGEKLGYLQLRSKEPGAGSQEAEEKKNPTICNYALGKLNSRKQTVNIILHKTNRRCTEIHIQFLEVTHSTFKGA